MKRFLISLMMIILLTMTTSAQDNDANTLPNLTLTTIESVGDIVDGAPHTATLSPDGNLLIYEGGDTPGLCVYNFSTLGTTCTPYPEVHENGEEVRLRRPTELKWSPDSRFVALTENSLIYLEDSDIWLYDVGEQSYTNRTQDGYGGRILGGDDFNSIPIDVLPTWSPDGSLYFFRYLRSEDVITTQLFTIPASGGSFAGVIGDGERTLSDEDPLEVADYTDNTSTPYAFFNGSSGFSLSGAAEVSPDGTQMALLMRPLDPDAYEIWIVSLSDGSVFHRIPTSALSSMGLPEWAETRGFVPEGITWLSDDELVVNFANYTFGNGIGWTAYHIDLITDQFTPIFDFASVPSEDDYMLGTQTDSDLVIYPRPRYGAVTPDRDYLLYVTSPSSVDGATLEAISVLGGERLILYQFGEDFDFLPAFFTSIGTDGETVRALIHGYIFTFEVTE